MKKTFKEWQDSIEPIDDFNLFSLRESHKKDFYDCIEYIDFKILLEILLKKYNTVITDYSIDINDSLYIRCDLEIEKKEELKKFYTEFRNLLKTEHYYIMGYLDNNKENYKKDITFEQFIKNKNLRLFLDKIYDIPKDIKDLKYLYHVTYKDIYETDIKYIGLIPSKKEMVSHEPKGKVYFFTNKNDCHTFIKEKRINFKKESILNDDYFCFLENNINEIKHKNNFIYSPESCLKLENLNYDYFVILKIDLKSVGPIKIYKDRKEIQRDAYYTYDKIPYYSIILDEDNL